MANWRRGVGLVVAAVALAGCGTTAGLQTWKETGGSMEPTLKIGEQLTVDTLAYRHAAPKLGDIVLLHPDAS